MMLSGLIGVVPSLVPTIAGGAVQLFTGLMDGLNEVIPQLMEMLPKLINNIGNTLIENLPIIIESGFQILINLIRGITNAIPSLITQVAAMIPVIVGALTSPAGISALITAGIDLIVALAKGLPEAIPAIVAAIPTIIAAIIITFMEQDWGQIGIDIMLGIGNGIIEGVKALAETIKEAAKSVLKSAKSAFEIHSPSVLFRDEVGKYLAQGIGVAFERGMSSVNKQMFSTVNLPLGYSGNALKFQTSQAASDSVPVFLEVKTGNIVIQGSADNQTIAQIQRAQAQATDDAINKIIRMFNGLYLAGMQKGYTL